MRVGDDKLDPAQAAPGEAFEECRPERLGLAGTDVQADAISRLPSVFAPMAIMAATETMHPPSRCLG